METLTIKGKIYCIRNNINDKIYIGSTTQSLSSRMGGHRRDSLRKVNYKIYQAFNELGIENFYIELIENYDCKTKEELRAREQHFIRLHNSLNNGYNGRCAIPDEIRKNERKEYEKNYKRIHYEEKKYDIIKYQKEYYEENKDYVHLRNKIYRENNKEILKEKSKQKVFCEICKYQITIFKLPRHKRSILHQNNLLTLNTSSS